MLPTGFRAVPAARPALRQLATVLLAAALSTTAFAGKVTGRITNSSGAAVADVTVTLVPGDLARASRQTLKTNKDGNYLFGIVPDGSFTLEVSSGDLVPSTVKLTVYDLARKKNLVDYSGPAPVKPTPFTVDVNTTVTY